MNGRSRTRLSRFRSGSPLRRSYLAARRLSVARKEER
jgi:hypothetical protein